MRTFGGALLLALAGIAGGCHYDIVCTDQLGVIDHKCVYIKPIESENPYVGKVIRDVLEKEFVRQQVEICDADNATILLDGSAFMTVRFKTEGLLASNAGHANQAIESVSVIARDTEGRIILSASYDNTEQYTAGRLAKQFGAELAKKLK